MNFSRSDIESGVTQGNVRSSFECRGCPRDVTLSPGRTVTSVPGLDRQEKILLRAPSMIASTEGCRMRRSAVIA
jgi:hypothetical protein